MPSKRYRLKLATWIVVRETEEPSPRRINNPDDAARIAREFVRASDDDKEHFWVVLLNQKHRYLMHMEGPVNTYALSAGLYSLHFIMGTGAMSFGCTSRK